MPVPKRTGIFLPNDPGPRKRGADQRAVFHPQNNIVIAYNKLCYYFARMSDNIGFLIGDISRLIRRTFDQRAKAIGVTRPQWRVLTWLQRHEGINQSALADLLELDAMTLCRMVDRLQSAELVERRADPSDRRAWQLFLTPKGIGLTGQLKPIGEQLLQEALHDVPNGEREKLQHLLEQFRRNLQSIDDADFQQKRATNC